MWKWVQNFDCVAELHALAARRPVATVVMASSSGIGEGGGGMWWALVGTLFCGLLVGGVLCFIILEVRRRRRATRIPSSPHYMSQQNSYVSVPLKEVPKKRQPSFSGTSPGGLGPAKANNLNSDRGTPKLYPKAITGDYEGATMKRNSNAPLRNNINLEQEKFNWFLTWYTWLSRTWSICGYPSMRMLHIISLKYISQRIVSEVPHGRIDCVEKASFEKV